MATVTAEVSQSAAGQPTDRVGRYDQALDGPRPEAVRSVPAEIPLEIVATKGLRWVLPTLITQDTGRRGVKAGDVFYMGVNTSNPTQPHVVPGGGLLVRGGKPYTLR